MTILSKSKIIAFRQCPKRLWLELHHPELKEVSESSEAAFQIGYEVGDAARKIYDPKGEGALLDVESEGVNGAIARTTDLLATIRNPIFEAGFEAAGGRAFADVLLPDEPRRDDVSPPGRRRDLLTTRGRTNLHPLRRPPKTAPPRTQDAPCVDSRTYPEWR